MSESQRPSPGTQQPSTEVPSTEQASAQQPLTQQPSTQQLPTQHPSSASVTLKYTLNSQVLPHVPAAPIGPLVPLLFFATIVGLVVHSVRRATEMQSGSGAMSKPRIRTRRLEPLDDEGVNMLSPSLHDGSYTRGGGGGVFRRDQYAAARVDNIDRDDGML